MALTLPKILAYIRAVERRKQQGSWDNDYEAKYNITQKINVDTVRVSIILALGLNLLDPVSCRGLFALFALARRHTGTLALGFML